MISVAFRRSFTGAVACWIACCGGSALAVEVAPQEPAERVRLEYRAPPSCPTAAQFAASVRARLSSGWEAAAGELARPLEVSVVEQGDRYVASLRFEDSANGTVMRQVNGKSCDEVVSGMALVAALAIVARVGEAAKAPAAPATAPVPSAAPPAATVPAVPKTPPPERSVPPAERSVWIRVGASGAVMSGVGPGAAFGAGGFAGVEGSHWYIGVAAQWTASGEVTANGVASEFRLLAGRLEGCPIVFGFARRLAFEPCAMMEAGQLEGEAYPDPPRVAVGETGAALWVAAGVVARVVGKLDPLVLELDAIVRVPLIREQFYVSSAGQPDTVYEVPAVSVGATLGLGARF